MNYIQLLLHHFRLMPKLQPVAVKQLFKLMDELESTTTI
jgi:hypothetical protein